MTTHLSRALLHLAPLVALLTLALVTPAMAQDYRIQAAADPTRQVFVPESENRVTITVMVLDATGQPAKDRVPVNFHTTLGTLLNTVAYTERGMVSMLLTNTAGPGKATVDVTVGNARQTIYVEYLGQGGAVSQETKRPRFTLTGQRVYYSVDKRLFDVCGTAQFVGANFSVLADMLQYSVTDNVLTAQNDVILRAGTKMVSARKLVMQVDGGKANLVVMDPDIRFVECALPTLELRDSDAARAVDYRAQDSAPTKTWVICKRATVFPGDMILFRAPEFYLNDFDHRIYSLPYHVLDLRASSAGMFFNSEISLTSDAGLNVDFPIYYAATGDHLGALHLRNVTKGSPYYRGVSGLQVGIEEEYLIGDKADGGVSLEDLTNPTRGVTWEHRHRIGRMSVSLNGSYDRYTPDTPYTARLGFSASQEVKPANLTLTSNWSDFDKNRDATAELNASFTPIKLGKTGVSLGFGPYVGGGSSQTSQDGQSPQTTDSFYQGMRINVGVPTVRFLGATLTTSMSNDIGHDQDGVITNYYDASLSLRRPLGRFFNTSLGYSFGHSTSTAEGAIDQRNQRVSLDFTGGKTNAWNLYSFASYNVENTTLYSSLSLTYHLPWFRSKDGTPRAYAQYEGNLMQNGASETADHLFSLGYNIGTYTVVLHYSPTGNSGVTGIGSGTGHNWGVELLRVGF